jgi:poly-gamma-glutamate capsule biosynthesis protein CapA/YwtB (metallophosphatase superfamily)
MDQYLCLFVCGDVMTGRGIDQILPHPGDPSLYEPYVHDARDYLRLAEAAHGPIRHPAADNYIWGEARKELDAADVRIVNLETSITTSGDYWPGKEVHYRMNPQNTGCLTAARIDCCALANNHVLDWGYRGLAQTLATLDRAGIQHAGAGADTEEAEAPAILPLSSLVGRLRGSSRPAVAPGGSAPGSTQPTQASGPPTHNSELGTPSQPPDDPRQGRVLVFSFGSMTSGIPPEWAAGRNRPGVNLLEDLSDQTGRRLASKMRAAKGPGDIVVASIHWGGNWGYEIPDAQIRFAHHLIEEGVDLVHGHSSHHVKALDVYRGRLILYGCGDLLTDYEGIQGHEMYRGDLGILYFIRLDRHSGELIDLRLVPMQVRRFRLRRAAPADVQWVRRTLHREGAQFGIEVSLNPDNSLSVYSRGS